jgi:three-Cys-motif partner protein
MTKEGATAGIKSTAQRFGGPWTLLKTDIIASYLQFFVNALKNQPFKLVYIDAFAGSGAFKFVSDEDDQGSLFGPAAKAHRGSAQRALELAPPFDELIFIERGVRNVRSLQQLIVASGHEDVSVQRGYANKVLLAMCNPTLWLNRRGVIFLDPFGMDVAWETLATIRKTDALDLWLLYPLAGTVRNLPRRLDRLDADKRAAVRRQLGNDDWVDLFYQLKPPECGDLFDSATLHELISVAIQRDIGQGSFSEET